jgi:hypothetical protein
MEISRDFERYAAIAAIVLLVIGCYLILRPFLTAFLWGAIIAVSTRGMYARFVRLLRGRHGLAAALTGLGLAAILLVPIALLGLKLAGQIPALSERFTDLLAGGIPHPPMWIGELPLIAVVGRPRAARSCGSSLRAAATIGADRRRTATSVDPGSYGRSAATTARSVETIGRITSMTKIRSTTKTTTTKEWCTGSCPASPT